jgi:EmrB/QacA subfamily drug resistance transporter
MGTRVRSTRFGGVRATVATLSIAVAAFAFQQTAITPAIPTIEHELGASQAWSAWLLSGYLLASAVFTPVLGKLADRFGKRRLLLGSLVVFLLGSIGAALAPSLVALVAARFVQGAGGAVFPLALAIARDELDPEATRSGIGLLTGAFGAGTIAGFGMAGVITEAASWRWIFGAGAGAVLLALVLAAVAVPRSPDRHEAPLDLPGAALLAGGLALVLVALTEGPLAGWTSPFVIGAAVAGAGLLAWWLAHDLRADAPLLDIRVLAARPVLLTNGASALVGYVLFGVFYLVPYLVEAPQRGYGFGAGPIAAGLYLLPAAVGQTIAGPLAGRLGRRHDPRWPFAGGMAMAAAGAAWLALSHAEPWEVLAAVFLLGCGFGAAIGVASALVTQAAPASESGIAAALNSVVRRVGGGFGGQISAALLAGSAAGGAAPGEGAFVLGFAIAAGLALTGTAMALAVRAG